MHDCLFGFQMMSPVFCNYVKLYVSLLGSLLVWKIFKIKVKNIFYWIFIPSFVINDIIPEVFCYTRVLPRDKVFPVNNTQIKGKFILLERKDVSDFYQTD